MNKSSLDDIIIIGITGGISSGKSEVCRIIKSEGFTVIDTDFISKNILNTSDYIKKLLIAKFGEDIYLDSGSINIQLLSKKVFSEDQQSNSNLEYLNSIVHPLVIDTMIEEIEQKASEGSKLIFVESALIFEAELDEGFDYIVDVDTIEDIRVLRFIEKTGLTKQDFELRNKKQLSAQYKRENSDFVIENNKDFENLMQSTKLILEIIKFLPKKQIL